jgi:hypothetical protein
MELARKSLLTSTDFFFYFGIKDNVDFPKFLTSLQAHDTITKAFAKLTTVYSKKTGNVSIK